MNTQVEGADVSLVRLTAEEMGIKVDGRWSDSRIQEEIDKYVSESKVISEPKQEGPTEADRIAKMCDLAQRQYDGQSPNLGLPDRAARIRMALKKHGYSDILDKVEIDESTNLSFENPKKRKLIEYL